MSERINRETGCRYARFDGTIVNTDAPRSRERVPSWQSAQIYCLKHRDYEAAELIASRNLISDECAGGAHDDCYFRWCPCPHHSAVQFELERPLKSLREVKSELDELEYA